MSFFFFFSRLECGVCVCDNLYDGGGNRAHCLGFGSAGQPKVCG